MNRRDTLLAMLALGTAPLTCSAQQQSSVRRIGFLAARSRSTPTNPDAYYDAFMRGMRELGYLEGKNLVIEWRFADGNYSRLPALASELVRMNVEVIVTHSTAATLAARRATNSIPIVTAAVADMVGSGIAKNLAHPEGNITGFSQIVVNTSPKHIELLKIMMPKLLHIAILVNPGNVAHLNILKSVQAAAGQFGITVLQVDARTPEEIEFGFAEITRGRSEVILIAADGFFIGQRQQIVSLATKYRLPSMFAYREDVQAGGLLSYGQNVADFYRRAATYVDKILKGAKPGELPIEQPMNIHLAINRKTAKTLGLTIPQELLLRADEIIE
jgi:ABC-type uncharacterized transport system substrate-binding protein